MPQAANIRPCGFVVQKYMEVPLLINKRKFDIRVWALVTHEGKAFVFREGYIRTSSEEYNLNATDITKDSIHLTNNAVQKNMENYGRYEEGNILAFSHLQAYLDAQQGPADYVRESLLPQIKNQVALSLEAVRSKLAIDRGCFELFGYDFLIDANMKAWLIEVNTNPCLEEPSKILTMYIHRMINDALKLTVDQAFPPRRGMEPYKAHELNQYRVDGYPDDINMWDFIM
jgi:Tubulin-tyrosine ligase family